MVFIKCHPRLRTVFSVCPQISSSHSVRCLLTVYQPVCRLIVDITSSPSSSKLLCNIDTPAPGDCHNEATAICSSAWLPVVSSLLSSFENDMAGTSWQQTTWKTRYLITRNRQHYSPQVQSNSTVPRMFLQVVFQPFVSKYLLHVHRMQRTMALITHIKLVIKESKDKLILYLLLFRNADIMEKYVDIMGKWGSEFFSQFLLFYSV